MKAAARPSLDPAHRVRYTEIAGDGECRDLTLAMSALVVSFANDVCCPINEEEAMRRSTERVLTTHVGSLPRPDELTKLHVARQEGQRVDEAVFEDQVRSAVDEVVRRQVEAGVAIVSDGEMSKSGYFDYTSLRVSGFKEGSVGVPYYFSDLQAVPELSSFTGGLNRSTQHLH